MEENNGNGGKRIKKRFIFATLFLLLVIGINVYLKYAPRYETTDNAYIETDAVQVAPKVYGQIIDVYVKDNQFIKEGYLIAEIDVKDYQTKLSEISARYDMALLKQKNAKAELKAVSSELDLAKRNLERYESLYQDGAASKLDFDNAKTNFDMVNAKLTQANQNILSSSNSRVADAELKQLAAAKKQAQLNLSYTKIYAPQTGFVTNKSVAKGAYVQVGQPLLKIVPQEVWIIANFKENQLEGMKVGQLVEIKIDTYPKKTFKGKIDSFQRSSGAKSSLFPPENAVGSFVKIVQRIPVKIVFTEKIDQQKYTVVPGMSVVPKIRVR